jgi:hypothetical protein
MRQSRPPFAASRLPNLLTCSKSSWRGYCERSLRHMYPNGHLHCPRIRGCEHDWRRTYGFPGDCHDSGL